MSWTGDKHVTPHGYRASIATLLDDRGMERINVQYLLGHSITKDNIEPYLRRDNRKIRALRADLTKIEEGIYQALQKRLESNSEGQKEEIPYMNDAGMISSNEPVMDEGKITLQDFVELTKINPALAQKLAAMNMVAL